MTIEGDILKKLASIKKDIKDFNKVENEKGKKNEQSLKSDKNIDRKIKNVKNIDKKIKNVKNIDKKINNDGSIVYSSEKAESSILLLFDATGSMIPFWRQTQKIMKEMIDRITKVGRVKLKCVAYRDHCDGAYLFESSGWYIKADPLIEFLSRIKCTGGGDTPEAVEDALKLAYEEKENVTRVILIGDAPPHSLEDAGKQAMNLGKKGINVFAFPVGGDSTTRNAFREIATLSKGSFGDLNDYKDLLDLMSITIVHDVGGHDAVEKYIKEYETSDDVKKYSKSLPSYKKENIGK